MNLEQAYLILEQATAIPQLNRKDHELVMQALKALSDAAKKENENKQSNEIISEK